MRLPIVTQSMRILGVRIDDITMDETLDIIAQMVENSHFHQILTVNPEFIMRAQHDRVFRDVLESSSLATPDGTGIIIAARWQGRNLRERVTGVMLTKALAQTGYRLFLLGAAPGVADQAAAALKKEFPSTTIVGTWAGSPRPADATEIIARIQAAQAEIVLVAYGAPSQDIWLSTYGHQLNAKIGIGIGGTLDYLAGVQPYAPRLVRQYGLEWLYRLITQPKRWKRIWTAVVQFSWAAWREARQLQR